MPTETPAERTARMAANTAAGVPQDLLDGCPRWDVRVAELTESTDEYLIDYDWEPVDDTATLTLRRTVWLIAHRRKDQHIIWQGVAATVPRSQVPAFVRDLVSCLSV